MEQGEAEKAERGRSDAEAQTDAVDHARLARLVAARHEPAMSAAPAALGERPKKSPALLIAFGIIVVGLILGAIGAYFLFFSKPETANANQPPDKKPPKTGQPTAISIKPDLVQIPGGTFQMGRNDGSPVEGPVHTVTVQLFLMDRTEVTNAEYELFVRETKHRVPSHWADNLPLAGQDQWPVANVSYDDAVAFAAWRSKRDGVTYRLPTEEEWEYAARNGEQSTLYPWGNSWNKNLAVIDEVSPRAVGSLPDGKNRWGVVDLIGNVWEWTSSKATLYPGNDRDFPADMRDWMIYRGGSYGTTRQRLATGAMRDWQKPSTMHPTLGFRLVRDAQ